MKRMAVRYNLTDRWPIGSANGTCPHSNGSAFTADGFFGPSTDARMMFAAANPPARMNAITMPMYSRITDFSLTFAWGPTFFNRGGAPLPPLLLGAYAPRNGSGLSRAYPAFPARPASVLRRHRPDCKRARKDSADDRHRRRDRQRCINRNGQARRFRLFRLGHIHQ